MKISIIDNYDSFTFNLVQLLEDISGTEISVMRNDQIDQIGLENSTHIILSPGPSIPDEAGELKKVIEMHAMNKKILGVCLGHQAIAEVFGGSIRNMTEVYHGIQEEVSIKKKSELFKGLPNSFSVGKYHSWVVDRVPESFNVTSRDLHGNVMSMEHNTLPIFGLQFHPESILTPQGEKIIKNFLNYA